MAGVQGTPPDLVAYWRSSRSGQGGCSNSCRPACRRLTDYVREGRRGFLDVLNSRASYKRVPPKRSGLS
jgi:hypothetical protein